MLLLLICDTEPLNQKVRSNWNKLEIMVTVEFISAAQIWRHYENVSSLYYIQIYHCQHIKTCNLKFAKTRTIDWTYKGKLYHHHWSFNYGNTGATLLGQIFATCKTVYQECVWHVYHHVLFWRTTYRKKKAKLKLKNICHLFQNVNLEKILYNLSGDGKLYGCSFYIPDIFTMNVYCMQPL